MRSSLATASTLFAAIAMMTDVALAHPRIRLSASNHKSKVTNPPAWRLSVSKDDFSEDVQCQLYSVDGRMIYQPHTLGFRFDRDENLPEAWVRIDDGEAMRWRDMFPELARARVKMDGRSLDSPTDGMVWIPMSMLMNTDSIGIQAKHGKKPHIFLLGDFRQTLEHARAQGCTPEERFIP